MTLNKLDLIQAVLTPCAEYVQAPEVLLGMPTSFPADIYSFGVVLLEIVLGQGGSKRVVTRDRMAPLR